MGVYYPQAVMILRVLWEDFSLKSDARLQQVYKLPIIARRVTVHINDYTTADTFDAEIDYKNFPFDPRCIRSCGVSIYIQDMKRIFRDDNRLNILEPSEENVVFQGFVDEESVTFDDDKRVVKLEGRDFTSLLLDEKYLQGKPVVLTTPLDQLLKDLLAQVKGAAEIKVENRTGASLPPVERFYPDFNQPLAGRKNVAKNDTYWEIIQDIIARAGLIAFIELDKLVISLPRVLYNENATKQFVYGGNIKNLTYKRKLGRHKGFNVAVRSMDLSLKKVELVQIPKEGTPAWSEKTGVKLEEVMVSVMKADGTLDTPKVAPYLAFRISDVTNREQLISHAEGIFEELSRQQIEGNFETHEMEVSEVSGKCFDVTKLRVGAPVGIEISQGDLEGISRLTTVDERERFLKARCFEPTVARAFAMSMGKFSPTFFTKSAMFTVDADSGFKLKVDFLNFIKIDGKGFDFA